MSPVTWDGVEFVPPEEDSKLDIVNLASMELISQGAEAVRRLPPTLVDNRGGGEGGRWKNLDSHRTSFALHLDPMTSCPFFSIYRVSLLIAACVCRDFSGSKGDSETAVPEKVPSPYPR